MRDKKIAKNIKKYKEMSTIIPFFSQDSIVPNSTESDMQIKTAAVDLGESIVYSATELAAAGGEELMNYFGRTLQAAEPSPVQVSSDVTSCCYVLAEYFSFEFES